MVVGFQVPMHSGFWHREVISGQNKIKKTTKGNLIVVSVPVLKSRSHLLDPPKAETLACLEIISVNPH